MRGKKVPVKTNEGSLEIKNRALGLAPRIRTALLLVDGVKSVAALERLMTAAGVTAGALQLLLDKGLIRFSETDRPANMAAAAAVRLVADIAKHGVVAAKQDIPATEAVANTVSPTMRLQTAAKAPNTAPAPASASAVTALQPNAEPASAEPTLPIAKIVSTFEVKCEPNPAPSPETAVRAASTALEVVTLLELKAIMGEATILEMETIVDVVTKLEFTPMRALAPKTAVKAPVSESVRLPPLAQAEFDYRFAAKKKMVVPASVLRMNLIVARAHLANALDQFLEIDGYILKQKVVACETREEIESLFGLVEGALIQKMDKPTSTRIMGVARAVLER